MLCRQIRDPFLVRIVNGTRRYHQSVATHFDCLFEHTLVLIGAVYLHRMKLQTEFPCWQKTVFPFFCGAYTPWVPQHCNAGALGNGFLEQLQSFAGQLHGHGVHAREVPARPRQAVNQPNCNRITPTCKNDRNRLSSVLDGYGGSRRDRDYYVNLETDQLVSQGGETVKLALRRSILDENVFAFHVPKLTQISPKYLHIGGMIGSGKTK